MKTKFLLALALFVIPQAQAADVLHHIHPKEEIVRPPHVKHTDKEIKKYIYTYIEEKMKVMLHKEIGLANTRNLKVILSYFKAIGADDVIDKFHTMFKATETKALEDNLLYELEEEEIERLANKKTEAFVIRVIPDIKRAERD